MRDLERWKDQVELSLDGRQIFFLFFGSAVAACVIFVAGVLVGKRIEQRGAAPAAIADPLAALDQIADEEEGLTFHEALARGEKTHAKKGKPESAPAPAAKPPAPVAAKPSVAAKPAAPVAAKPAVKPAPAKPAAAKPTAVAAAAKPIAP